MKLAVGLTGRIASGKGEVGGYLSTVYKASGHQFSQILFDILDRLHIPPERQALQKLGAILRSQFGADVIVHAFRKDLELDSADTVVVDGIRYPNEVEMLRSFENNILLFIDASPEIRFERVKKRNEKGEGNIDYEEFLLAENRETERYLDEIKGMADFIVENSGTLKELHLKIDELIKPRLP